MSQIAHVQISMVAVVLLLIALFEVLDYYFYRQVFYHQHRPKITLFLHWVLNFITVSGMISLFFLFGNHNSPLIQKWISVIFTLLLAQIWGKFLFMIGSLPRIWVKRIKSKRQFMFIGFFLLAATWVGMGTAVWNSFHPKVRYIEVPIKDLPKAFEDYSIVFLSDMHLGLLSTACNSVYEAVQITNDLKPDLILFGGDLVSLTSDEAIPFIPILSSLHSKDGKFAVRGNHDYGIYNRSNPNLQLERERFSEINKAMGITILDNQSISIIKHLDTIFLAGTEYFSPHKDFPDGLDKALQTTSSDHPIILLTHNPDHFAHSVLDKKTIDLTLSGHTHAMQFVVNCFGNRISPSALLFDHWGGFYQYDDQSLYVNEGFGASLYSIRWGTRSEITHIVLKNKSRN